MDATRFLAVVFGVALAVGVGCKNSKYCDDGSNSCPPEMMCNLTMHACVASGGAGGAGGAGGKAGGGGGGGRGGSGGRAFRCDASAQCADHDAAAPICEIDASTCYECVKDKDCKDKASPICGSSHACVPCTAGSNQCATFDAGTPFCSSSGCVQCGSNADCAATAPTPICDLSSGTCKRCTSDAQCADIGSGVCMFHQDGRCATMAETIYVQFTSSSCPSTSKTGTVASPFCGLDDARSLVATSSTVDVIVVLGTSDVPAATGAFVPANAQTELSFVGQPGVTILGGVYPGLHISGSRAYMRGLTVTGSTNTAAIVAELASTIRLDGVTINNNQKGGLAVTGSSYDIENSIFASNGSGTVNAATFGGVFLGTPPGGLARFDFNTVVQNQDRGAVCENGNQQINASLFNGNMGGGSGILPDVSTCILGLSQTTTSGNPQLSPTYRLTTTSPCKDFVATPPANPPDHDIDGVSRPQGSTYDCGASEYKSQ